MSSVEATASTPPKVGKGKKAPKAKKDTEYQAGARILYTAFDVTISKVNNALFKVHRHFLMQHSTVLHDMLEAPESVLQQEVGLIEGTQKPLFNLSGDTVKGWECVLAPFYRDDPFSTIKYNAEEWAALLVIANKYVMARMEMDAVRGLKQAKPPLDMVEMMVIAQKVQSDDLYQLALQSLAQREQVLSLEEAQRIGLKAFHDVITTEHVYFVRSRRDIHIHDLQPQFIGTPGRMRKDKFVWGPVLIDSD
ncbi:hypothetical protein FRC17_005521 [Serendipita sp. 399]|nr:hypothetical protein FRC17_005521 [Serendipita sp. 399]